jgi:adenylosuccinate synthase
MDLVALKYVCMLNGVTDLIMTKADVLDNFDTIKIATAYKDKNGNLIEDFPFDITEMTPIYKEFKGWNKDTTQFNSENEFPQELKDYISFIEKETGVRISIVSLGPDRTQTIKIK